MRRTLSLLLFLAVSAPAGAADWTSWRGPLDNGFSPERDLPAEWDAATKKNLVWASPGNGGRTTPLIMKGRLYAIAGTGSGPTQQERVFCLDADSGKLIWERKFDVFHTDIVADRLGWTNMAADPETETVFAHTTAGLLLCLDRDGKTVWQRSLTEEYGRISGYGGRLNSPVVDEDQVIIGLNNASWGDQAAGRNRFVSFDKKTGAVRWWASTGNPVKDSYSSTPVVAVIGGQRLLISGGGDGFVHAFQARTGVKVWSFPFADGGINCSPVVQGDRVYIGHGDANISNGAQGSVVCLDGAKVKEGKPEVVWQLDGIKVKFASPVLHEGKLYVCDDLGKLYAIDAEKGERLWRLIYGRNTKGSPVLADGKLYLADADGRFCIVDPEKKKIIHAAEFPAHDGVPTEVLGSPAVVNGRVYFMTTTTMYCIGKPDRRPGPVTAPKRPAEAGLPGKVAHIQVRPADVVLHPGESAKFEAFGYDANGKLVGPVEALWALEGQSLPEGAPKPPEGAPKPQPLQGDLAPARGDAVKSVTLTVKPAPPTQAGRVVATNMNLLGEARVRVAPALPYKPDFSKIPEGRSPSGWVNAQGKFVVEKLKDGSFVLSKTTAVASPLVARVNTYMAPPGLHDYTVEAEVMGLPNIDGLPDIGLVAARYTLMLAGNRQELRLVSWDALPRVDKTIAQPWKGDVWYSLKISHEVKQGKAIVRGKFWQTGQPEPQGWQLEVTDDTPNTEGSPGLYGYAVGAVPGKLAGIHYRDISVTPNKK
jgi:outer membrane protein assembly factor BamB